MAHVCVVLVITGVVLMALAGGVQAGLTIEQPAEAGWVNKTAFIVRADPGALEFTVSSPTGVVLGSVAFTPQLLDCPPGKCFVFGSRLPSVAEPVECSVVDDPQKCVEPGYTYTIQSATEEDSATVDLGMPGCTMDAPPAFSRNPVSLSWSGSDVLSGIRLFSLERSADGTVFFPLGTSTGTTASQTLPDGTTVLRCRAQDNAGNVGAASPAVFVNVDSAGPIASFHHLQPWSSLFSRYTVLPDRINVSWNFSDPSGIQCFRLQWAEGVDNASLVFTEFNKGGSTCLTGTSEVVGDEPGEPVLQEGKTFHFRLFATDNLGNQMAGYSYTTTTIDFTQPTVAMGKRIGADDITSSVRKAEDTSSVTVSLAAADSGSGIAEQKLLYRFFPGVGEFEEVVPGPAGYTFQLRDGEDAKELEVKGVARDRAGNIRETGSFFVLRRPLVRLAAAGVGLTVGQAYPLEVSVRNPLEVADTITVDVCGTSCPDYFIPEIVVPVGVVVSGRKVTFQLPPLSATSFTLRLVTTAESAGTGTDLLVFGHSAADPSLDDVDGTIVTVDFPPEFPDLNGWAIVLLMGGSLAVFWKKGENGF